MENLEKRNIAKRYRLVTPNDAKKFVWITSKFKGTVQCSEAFRVIDGKSILGVLSMDLIHPILVTFYDVYGNEKEFEELKEWEVFVK